MGSKSIIISCTLDLASSKFNLFPNLKECGKWYADKDELKSAVNEYLRELSKEFYAHGIEQLKHQYERCIAIKGEYDELFFLNRTKEFASVFGQKLFQQTSCSCLDFMSVLYHLISSFINYI